MVYLRTDMKYVPLSCAECSLSRENGETRECFILKRKCPEYTEYHYGKRYTYVGKLGDCPLEQFNYKDLEARRKRDQKKDLKKRKILKR